MITQIEELPRNNRKVLAEMMENIGFTIAAQAIRATRSGDSSAGDLRRAAVEFVNRGTAIRGTVHK